MHQDRAISVFDLAAVMPGRTPARGDGQIVVLEVPSCQARFGILVVRSAEAILQRLTGLRAPAEDSSGRRLLSLQAP